MCANRYIPAGSPAGTFLNLLARAIAVFFPVACRIRRINASLPLGVRGFECECGEEELLSEKKRMLPSKRRSTHGDGLSSTPPFASS